MSSYQRAVMLANEAMLANGIPTAVPAETDSAVIALNASLSSAVEINGDLAALIVPAAWTAAAVTFQGSVDGETFFDIYDAATERTIASGALVANHMLAVKKEDWAAFTHIKIRSGTAAAPVVQLAERTIRVVVAP